MTGEGKKASAVDKGGERETKVRVELGNLERMTLTELHQLARQLEISGASKMRKKALVFEIMRTQVEGDGRLFAQGMLEIMPENYGFLRPINYLPSDRDIYVSPSQIRRFDLRTGDFITGQARPPKGGENYLALLRIDAINEVDPGEAKKRLHFDALTPIFPEERFLLECEHGDTSTRLIDIFAPIGRGQRGLIVSPPKAGKTMLLKKIANSLTENHPDLHLMVLLIDERPEEVTDMERSVDGEVLASTFDQMPENHVRLGEMVLERARRLVENKHDVVILLDSITRLARAHNLVIPASGRTLSGGLDPNALHKPKRFFGAARNIEEGGSLTIIATALVDTGSRMDDVIYEEFKGTGNMEIHLDRRLADRRVFPSVDIKRSGTRREELLLSQEDLDVMYVLRRVIANMDVVEATEMMIERLKKTRSNQDYFSMIRKEM